MVTLNHAVAVAMVHGPRAGLDLLATLDDDDRDRRRTTGSTSVRAHLLEMAGDHAAARDGYRAAARRTTSLPEQRYLEARAARLTDYHRSPVGRSDLVPLWISWRRTTPSSTERVALDEGLRRLAGGEDRHRSLLLGVAERPDHEDLAAAVELLQARLVGREWAGALLRTSSADS